MGGNRMENVTYPFCLQMCTIGYNAYMRDIGVEGIVNWPWITSGLRSGAAKLQQ